MSTDQYPEVTGDDSGIVPPNPPRADWPKKIRTLSAAELDRLTIDSAGRFYWDGQLVNYQPPQPAPQPSQAPTSGQPVDVDALALLDRATRELSSQPATAGTPTGEPAQSAVPPSGDTAPADAQVAVEPVNAITTVATVANVPQIAPMPILDMARAAPEKVRLRMSFWQSAALFLAVVGLLIGAAGIAVSGLVAGLEWGCRTNLVKQYCPPPPPPPRAPARIDIPA